MTTTLRTVDAIGSAPLFCSSTADFVPMSRATLPPAAKSIGVWVIGRSKMPHLNICV